MPVSWCVQSKSFGQVRLAKMETSVAFCTLLLFTVLAQQRFGAEAAPDGALVEKLPGFSGEFASKHYAGYITVSPEHERSLYYYFVTSEGDPASDPVVLWLNGGPGCSSFDGFIYEHGPFNFEPSSEPNGLPTLVKNPYSWAKNANIIYLDSPSGVGYSYSKNKADYLTGDLQTAADSHTFLLDWFQAYPEFQSNPFFISGESYAGIYVPTLARKVAEGIAAGEKPAINLKGYIVGNGCTDEKFDGDALVPFVYGMGLISIDLYTDANVACGGSFWNASSRECIRKIEDIYNTVDEVNVYDILEPCYHPTSPSSVIEQVGSSENDRTRLPRSFRRLGESNPRTHPVRKRMFGRAWPLRSGSIPEGRVPTWGILQSDIEVPCTDDTVANAWLNDPVVREALHAQPHEEIGNWVLCTDQILFWHDAGSMLPIHRRLIEKGYRALIFSGDHDMCVPYTGSEAWTRSLGYPVSDHWRPWHVSGQVVGYTRGYAHGTLTFATVKGAGHTVPEYKPEEALALFQRWLAGSPL